MAIQVATGTTAIFPGGATSYVLTQVRKIVTVRILIDPGQRAGHGLPSR
ncbi:MAG: hypothetical protein U1E17_15920 [Geminicoccaceae bacterium]